MYYYPYQNSFWNETELDENQVNATHNQKVAQSTQEKEEDDDESNQNYIKVRYIHTTKFIMMNVRLGILLNI